LLGSKAALLIGEDRNLYVMLDELERPVHPCKRGLAGDATNDLPVSITEFRDSHTACCSREYACDSLRALQIIGFSFIECHCRVTPDVVHR
jgi:hypothetical protein